MRKCSVIFMRGLLIFVVVVALGAFANIQKANAGEYLGDICLEVHATQGNKGPEDGTGIIKLGISSVGGTHYTAQGVILTPKVEVLGGVCEIVDSDIVCTLNYSEDHSPDPDRDSGIMQMHLNGSTLSGTFWQNFISFNASSGSYGEGYDVGTVRGVPPCP